MLDLPLLLVQLFVVLAAARTAGSLARAVGQPRVVGEMTAGVVLGPSVFGALAARPAAALFPPERLAPLSVLSQIGVLLFMFVVGLRLDLGALGGRTRAIVLTSQASLAAPFLLGLAIAPRLYPELAGPRVPEHIFALFVGVMLSVTAFPVLACIVAERRLTGTRVGAVALASAAADDVIAWCVLGGVVAVARAGGAWAGLASLAAAAAYGAFAVLVGRRALARLFAGAQRGATPEHVSLAVLVAIGSGLVTERIGVHALFGAFLAGAVMPRAGGFADGLAGRLDPLVTAVLLPIFFAFTGLHTSVALIDSAPRWRAGGLVLGAAVAGKLAGTAVASRAAGMSWREALSIGALMNTRGLMELAVATIALDAGVISPALFTIIVLMALVTTAMASPLLARVGAPVSHAVT